MKANTLGKEAFDKLIKTYVVFVEDILGLLEEKPKDTEGIIDIVIDLYKQAKATRDYEKVDEIRARLKAHGVALKDMKDGVGWAYEEL